MEAAVAGKRDERPRHQQVSADLRARIMSGDLPPGTQLPSTSQLVERYGAANATIQRALTALKNEGYLRSEVGRGVYVRDRQPIIVRVSAYFPTSPKGYSYRLLTVAVVTPPPSDVAASLNLQSENSTAVLRHRLLLVNGEPLELSWSYYPAAIAEGTALAGRAKIPGGAPKVLVELGYPERYFTDNVSCRPPTTEELEGLDLPEGVPVIRQLRVIYSDDEQPVEASVLVKGAHLYELQYRQAIPEH